MHQILSIYDMMIRWYGRLVRLMCHLFIENDSQGPSILMIFPFYGITGAMIKKNRAVQQLPEYTHKLPCANNQRVASSERSIVYKSLKTGKRPPGDQQTNCSIEYRNIITLLRNHKYFCGVDYVYLKGMMSVTGNKEMDSSQFVDFLCLSDGYIHGLVGLL